MDSRSSIKSRLKRTVSVTGILLFCGLTLAVNAETPHYFSYNQFPQADNAFSVDANAPGASGQEKLELLPAAAVKEKSLASRPSPYLAHAAPQDSGLELIAAPHSSSEKALAVRPSPYLQAPPTKQELAHAPALTHPHPVRDLAKEEPQHKKPMKLAQAKSKAEPVKLAAHHPAAAKPTTLAKHEPQKNAKSTHLAQSKPKSEPVKMAAHHAPAAKPVKTAQNDRYGLFPKVIAYHPASEDKKLAETKAVKVAAEKHAKSALVARKDDDDKEFANAETAVLAPQLVELGKNKAPKAQMAALTLPQAEAPPPLVEADAPDTFSAPTKPKPVVAKPTPHAQEKHPVKLVAKASAKPAAKAKSQNDDDAQFADAETAVLAPKLVMMDGARFQTPANVQAAKQQKNAIISSTLASAVLMSRSATLQAADAASDRGTRIAMAHDAAPNLGTLAPAAGEREMAAMPQPTMELPLPPAPATPAVAPLTPLAPPAPAAMETPLTPLTPIAPATIPGGPVADSDNAPHLTPPPSEPDMPAHASPNVDMPLHDAAEPAEPAEMAEVPLEKVRPLSTQSQAILHKLPAEKKPRSAAKQPVTITHFSKNPLESEEVRKHEGIGMSISVRKPKLNINHQLEEAYDALIAGNQEDAIILYKQVLEEQPENRMALFGLATTYHRAGQLQLARPLYGKLLEIDPQNPEGLNNFLVLLADESPAAAIEEMKRLEATHPSFSPLPAQMAVIYEKMGDYDAAMAKMRHAIVLSPENIKYRYDMAVIMDKAGDWDNAAVYYQQLLSASERGDKIPAKPEEIQERLTFIRSNRPKS